mmetsp:Transcript_19677/g.39932  ORF Transcript_19677/g.39932 Transcript_19677/m.39932 type:complete len:307 (+) Transcript_19677:109-1029(+)
MARFILALALLAATASAFVPGAPTAIAQQRATDASKSPAGDSSTALAYGYNSYNNGRGFLEYNDYFDRSTPNGEYVDPYSSYGRDKEQSSTYQPLFNQNRGYYNTGYSNGSYNNGYGRGYRTGRLSDEGKWGNGGYGYNALPSRSSYGGYRSSGRLSDMGKGYGYGPYSDGYRSGGSRDAYGRAYDRGYNDYRGYGGYRSGRLSDEGKYYNGGRRSYDGYNDSYRYGGYRTGRLSDEGRYYRGGYNGPYRSGYSSGYGYDSRPKGYGGITPTNDYRYSQSGTYKPLFGTGRSSYEEMAYSPNRYVS